MADTTRQDESAEFYSLECSACDEGTYTLASASTALPDRKCLA